VVLLLVLCATILAYLPVHRAAFVYDDFDYVVQNPLVTGPSIDLLSIFTTPYPPDHPEQKLYRPMVTLSYAIDHQLWGMADHPAWSPTRFHWTNLAWHLAAVVLLFGLVRQLQRQPDDPGCPWVAGLAVALFALHPLATESVAWISGRAELMAGAFGLASLLLALRYTLSQSWQDVMGAMILFALALLSKESAIVIPLLAGVLCWWQIKTGASRVTDRTWHRLAIGYIALAAIYLVVRAWCFRDVALANMAYADVPNPILRLLTALKVLAQYISLALIPYRQSVFHDVIVNWIPGLVATLALAGIGCILWLSRSRAPWLTLTGLWFLAALIPVSNLVIRIGSIMAERFLYLPLAGLGIGIGLGLTKLNRQRPELKWPFLLLALVLTHHTIKTFQRSLDWEDERTIWASAADVYPESFVPHAQLGFAWLASGNPSGAVPHLQDALLKLRETPATTRQQFEPRIAEALQQATRLATPSSPPPSSSSADLEPIHQLARRGQFTEAARRYEQYLETHPDNQPAARALADCYLRLREYPRAVETLTRLLARDAGNAILHGKLGFAQAGEGQVDLARQSYARALELNPADTITRANLASLEMQQSRWADARVHLDYVLQLRPEMTEARLNLALCLYQLGDLTAARAQAKAVLDAQPQHVEAARLLELIQAGQRAR
jgi:Flp pilus assembly protein TadD